jgi:hypothetical protein
MRLCRKCYYIVVGITSCSNYDDNYDDNDDDDDVPLKYYNERMS